MAAHAIGVPNATSISRQSIAAQRISPTEMTTGDVRRPIADTRLEVERLVERDAVEPRSELCVAAKRRERLVHTDEHFLSHLFGLRLEAVTEDRGHETKDRLTMSAHQVGERPLVAIAGACDQRVIGLGGHGGVDRIRHITVSVAARPRRSGRGRNRRP